MGVLRQSQYKYATRFDIERGRKKGYTYNMTHRRNNKSARTNAVKTDPVRAAAEFGIDIEALKENLKLSYSERIRRHQIKLNAMIKSGKPIKRPSDERMMLELEAIRELRKGKK